MQKNTPTFAADSPHISERTALSPTLRNLCNELPLKTILARKISIKNQHPLWDELSKYHLFNGFPHVSPFFSFLIPHTFQVISWKLWDPLAVTCQLGWDVALPPWRFLETPPPPKKNSEQVLPNYHGNPQPSFLGVITHIWWV